MKVNVYLGILALSVMIGCGSDKKIQDNSEKVSLLVIEPQHFHAALVQKYVHAEIDSVVHLFAQTDTAVEGYTKLIEQYNSRETDPTNWKIKTYYGNDFLDKAFVGETGNVVVLAGDNQKKIDYIASSAGHGRDVFADKPLVIETKGYQKLKDLLEDAKGTSLVYDIMTERYDVKNQVVKALINNQSLSGGMLVNDQEAAIQFSSVHHFIKEVSGSPLIRPVLFYNTAQQGEGLVDVTTHYIDLVQWMLSSEQPIDIAKDVKLNKSVRWKTTLTKADFTRSTNLPDYPAALSAFVEENNTLGVFSNGRMEYVFKDVPVSISVKWNVESKDGKGDQFHASFLTKQFKIEIKPDEVGKAAVFVTPNQDDNEFAGRLNDALASVEDLPGLKFEKTSSGAYKILIPDNLYLSHEDHFAKVLNQFLQYRKEGTLPDWEKSFMLAKYYLTTQALDQAKTVENEEI
ncbi:oxidoreductase [Parapedobacter sp. SGR-10]|uniref:putative oxidoreductase C-terminal domain-containing protein n=1 Tax=Parapedobacter sp. SGR-10 TaxID=2710879 RepID=UPI0013D8CD65|nr:putative oxidoreductase C-terminal domain-containing protein [Parapedobacter sp. SGR-10]NGF56372.1 oxidoreductase [Parapedobacter sp. SGR-10]